MCDSTHAAAIIGQQKNDAPPRARKHSTVLMKNATMAITRKPDPPNMQQNFHKCLAYFMAEMIPADGT
ncbi:MAG: hypothetical protein NTU41_02545 [Chloroflexi bacterium]|nr:hypothetical protein [Chloroflexota bacterium]